MSDIKKWDNDIYEWDVTKASKAANPWLKNYGKDRYTYSPEMHYTRAREDFLMEGPMAHGYPVTAWMQLSFVWLAGLYTAKEQGIVKKGVYFQNFFRAHYFDWLLFLRRAGIYGIGGGLVLGTFLFGDVYLSFKRAVYRYRYLTAWQRPDPRNTVTQYFIKNNS